MIRLAETVWQDLRQGVRIFSRDLSFTLITAFALASGIAVNTAAYTGYQAMVARKLDARDPDHLVNLALIRQSGTLGPLFSYPDYKAYRDHIRSFAGVMATMNEDLLLSGTAGLAGARSATRSPLLGSLGLLRPEIQNGELARTFVVSENFFSVLGVALAHGRTFASSGAPTVLISENYWRKRFAADPSILGRIIRLNNVAFAISGITPHNFVGTNIAVPDFWLPFSAEPLIHPGAPLLDDREKECCRLFARLAPGGSINAAQFDMTLVGNRLRALHPSTSELSKPLKALVWTGSPFPLPLAQYGGMRYAIQLIMAAAAMVLVIACLNVASLQLARTTSRRSELGMRLSLGASRLRLVRQLTTESILLGLLAGAIALPFSWALTSWLANKFGESLPAEFGTVVFHVTPGPGTLCYVVVLSVVAGVLFGLTPALESSHTALASAFKAGSKLSPIRTRRIRDFLITAQVSVSLMLLVIGSSFVHSAMNALNTDPGYDSRHVFVLESGFPEWIGYTPARKTALIRELRGRLTALPGVAAVTSANAPEDIGLQTTAIAQDAGNRQVTIHYAFVEPNYFTTLAVPLRLGRTFAEKERSLVISESTAEALWPKQSPLGRTIRLGATGGSAYQVIGVANDRRGFNLNGSDSKEAYLPLAADSMRNLPILVRTVADPAPVISAAARTVSAMDSNLLISISTLEERLRLTASYVTSTLAAIFASAVGLLGLLLAAMGIYGSVNYLVALRTREVGIRMAIGAQRTDILRLILRDSLQPAATGLLFGMLLSAGASFLLRGALYRLGLLDGISLAAMSALFFAVAISTAYGPSRRATHVDPVTALRYE